MAKKMWSFKTKNFTVIWEIEPDVLNTQFMAKEVAEECRKNVRSRKWKCFMSTVRVIENISKITLGEAYLGNSVYENPAEFRDHFAMNQKGHGSYFSQMVREAIAIARERLPALQANARQEMESRKKLLALQLTTRNRTAQHSTY